MSGFSGRIVTHAAMFFVHLVSQTMSFAYRTVARFGEMDITILSRASRTIPFASHWATVYCGIKRPVGRSILHGDSLRIACQYKSRNSAGGNFNLLAILIRVSRLVFCRPASKFVTLVRDNPTPEAKSACDMPRAIRSILIMSPISDQIQSIRLTMITTGSIWIDLDMRLVLRGSR